MCWKKLVFKQIQPIHLGKHKHGVINETRIFIPGQTIWGALVNSYAMENKKEFNDAKRKFTQISCFFPFILQDGEGILFPNYKAGDFHLGDKSEKKFRYNFTDTLVSTAIDSSSLGAKDESLHETDFILPKGKEKQSQLYWVGIIKVDKETEKSLQENELEIKVGGERNYGYGKLKLIEKSKIQEEELNEWNISEDGKIHLIKGCLLRNYFQFSKKVKFEGELELLPEIDFFKDDENPKDGENSTKNADILYITPGSKINNMSKLTLIKGKIK